MITKDQKEVKEKLEKLELDPFLIDRIVKFYPITINSFLKKVKEVRNEKIISKY